jgi:hypothetical protein
MKAKIVMVAVVVMAIGALAVFSAPRRRSVSPQLPVAYVNGQPIPISRVQDRVEAMRINESNTMEANLFAEALQLVINDEILIQYAIQQGMTIEEAELSRAVERIVTDIPQAGSEAEAHFQNVVLKRWGLTRDQFSHDKRVLEVYRRAVLKQKVISEILADLSREERDDPIGRAAQIDAFVKAQNAVVVYR